MDSDHTSAAPIKLKSAETTTRRRAEFQHRIFGFEGHAVLLALGAGALAVTIAIILLWTGDYSSKLRWTAAVFMILFWLAFAFSVRTHVMRPLQTLSNLIAGIREGDFSIRASGGWRDDSLGEVVREVNALSEELRQNRLAEREASVLLGKVITEIDVAIFAFDGSQRLRVINRTGERLLAQPSERLLARTAEELGLADMLEGEPERTVQKTFPGATGRWGLRRSTFRESGLPHQLVVISDLSRALQEEERRAWQRIIRVMGHEINNSLAPIQSLAGTLEGVLNREGGDAEWRLDMQHGLRVISTRAEALSRFMKAYSQLARLPEPKLAAVEIAPLVRRVAQLESRLPVRVITGPDMVIRADSDQLEQLLINLIRNAVDASLETKGGVAVSWRKLGVLVEIAVEDEGHGLADTANLFVPFFSTKPGGSGIGLVLSRQMAEAHGGSLALENRRDRQGCRALLLLPINHR